MSAPLRESPAGLAAEGGPSCPSCGRCAEVLARLARIERLLERLAPAAVETLAPPPPAEPAPSLLERLQQVAGGTCSTSRQLLGLARDNLDLADAFDAAGIRNPHALGRWLRDHEGQGVERADREAGGTVWEIRAFAGRSEGESI